MVPILSRKACRGCAGASAQPDQVGRELARHRRPAARIDQQVAAGDVDLVGQRQGDGPAGGGIGEIAVEADDALDPGDAARSSDRDRIEPTLTWPDMTVPAKPRNEASGRLTHCTGKRSGALVLSARTSTVSRWASSEGPAYHGVRVAALHDIVAVARRHRDDRERGERQRPGEGLEGALDLAEAALGEIDQVDLVDREHDVADAEQGGDRGMAPCLLDQAVAASTSSTASSERSRRRSPCCG